jgi:hypothetical protein
MWRKALLATLLCASAAADAAYSFDFQQFAKRAAQLKCDNSKQINWYSDFVQAQKRALREDKPILIFMAVQQNGNKSATDC